MGVMKPTDEQVADYHEHPWFNGQYHQAVWVQTWASSGSNDEAPPDAPVSCAICGRSKDVRSH